MINETFYFSLLPQSAYYTAHFVIWYLFPLTMILVMYGRISCTLWATSMAMTTTTKFRSPSGRGSVTVTQDNMSTQVFEQSFLLWFVEVGSTLENSFRQHPGYFDAR